MSITFTVKVIQPPSTPFIATPKQPEDPEDSELAEIEDQFRKLKVNKTVIPLKIDGRKAPPPPQQSVPSHPPTHKSTYTPHHTRKAGLGALPVNYTGVHPDVEDGDGKASAKGKEPAHSKVPRGTKRKIPHLEIESDKHMHPPKTRKISPTTQPEGYQPHEASYRDEGPSKLTLTPDHEEHVVSNKRQRTLAPTHKEVSEIRTAMVEQDSEMWRLKIQHRIRKIAPPLLSFTFPSKGAVRPPLRFSFKGRS